MVGAVEIGHGNRRAGAEHQRRRHLLGELVDGAGRVDIARGQGPRQDLDVEQVREVVDVGVAEVERRPSCDRPPAIGLSLASISSNASSQVASRNSSPSRISGSVSRSGSSCSARSAEPLGQMKPWLKTSSASPRIDTTRSPSSSSSSPQVASQSGQVRKAVTAIAPNLTPRGRPAGITCGVHCRRREQGQARGDRRLADGAGRADPAGVAVSDLEPSVLARIPGPIRPHAGAGGDPPRPQRMAGLLDLRRAAGGARGGGAGGGAARHPCRQDRGPARLAWWRWRSLPTPRRRRRPRAPTSTTRSWGATRPTIRRRAAASCAR